MIHSQRRAEAWRGEERYPTGGRNANAYGEISNPGRERFRDDQQCIDQCVHRNVCRPKSKAPPLWAQAGDYQLIDNGVGWINYLSLDWTGIAQHAKYPCGDGKMKHERVTARRA